MLTRKLTVVYLFLTTTEGNIAEEVMEEFMSAEGKDFMKLKGYSFMAASKGPGDWGLPGPTVSMTPGQRKQTKHRT